jgi:hypothetical protein
LPSGRLDQPDRDVAQLTCDRIAALDLERIMEIGSTQ